MRRFDGAEGVGTGPAGIRAGNGGMSWWTRLGRPQAGALVAALLVAVIGIPVALDSFDQWSPPRGENGPLRTAEEDAQVASTAPLAEGQHDVAQREPEQPAVAAEVPPAADAAAPGAPASVDAPTMQLTDAREIAEAKARGSVPGAAASPAFAPAPPPPPPAALGEEPVAEVRMNAARRAEKVRDVPVSTGPVRMSSAASEAADNIVVTSTRRVERGDWNACTVNDPRQSLKSCRGLGNARAKGTGGRLAEGLDRAWKGDVDGAIAAFDQAIASTPRSATAYLNRGMAWQRAGNMNRALADLDQAIRLDPDAARGYYHRSVVLRRLGNVKRARQDERRAIQLDPDYADVIR